MGSCVSVHKDPESALKLRLSFASKTDKLVIPSPEKHDTTVAAAAVKTHWSTTPSVTLSRDFGSKEETFFDSQPWLESDNEDDFFSVNGDYTPSRGSTPVHHSFSSGITRGYRNTFAGRSSKSIPEPSPPERKKRLSELFKDGAVGDQDPKDQIAVSNPNGGSSNTESKTAAVEVPPKSANATPYLSGANSVCSSERSPNGNWKPAREKSLKSAQCCLPRLRRSLSLSEKKKRSGPAAISVV